MLNWIIYCLNWNNYTSVPWNVEIISLFGYDKDNIFFYFSNKLIQILNDPMCQITIELLVVSFTYLNLKFLLNKGKTTSRERH